MSNRLEREFPKNLWHAVPPIGPDGQQVYLQRARQARAETLAAGGRHVARALAATFRGLANFVRCAGYGIAKRPPGGSYALTAPGRLTRDCR